MRLDTDDAMSYRYPGTKSFEPDQQNIFFGRKQETFDLIHSIKAHDVFVIFADSGIGKTSLLNAGLIPELAKENILPIKFRFQDTNISPLQIITDQLSVYSDPATSSSLPAPQKLWRLFRKCEFKNEQPKDGETKTVQPVVPLFIFDQFEEFFNHSRQNREECINQISDLVNDYLPDYIREEMKQKFRDRDPTEKELLYYSAAQVKMLFLIRSDKLKLLDDLSKKIPLILRNRFHLKPLNGLQAEQAILLPASLPRNHFISPSFSYQEEAVDEICRNLMNEEEEVESFQLQILCRELEKRIIERAQKGEEGLWISEKELGGKAGIESITKNYYTNQINSIGNEEERRKATLLIENKLIIDEKRISLPESFLLNEGYSKELLDYLLNVTRIIRVDNNRNIEISHDRLIPPILKSREQREKKEQQLREEEQIKKFEEETSKRNSELIKERRTKRRFLYFLIAVTIMFITSMFFFIRMMKSDSAAKIATVNYLRAQQDFTGAERVLTSNNLFSGFNFYNRDTLARLKGVVTNEKLIQKEYIEIVRRGDFSRNMGSTYLNIADSLIFLADSLAGIGQLDSFYKSTKRGEQLEKAIGGEELLSAIRYYLKATDMEFNTLYDSLKVEPKLSDLEASFKNAFEQCINSAFIFDKLNDKNKRQSALAKAQQIKHFADDKHWELNPVAVNDLDSLINAR